MYDPFTVPVHVVIDRHCVKLTLKTVVAGVWFFQLPDRAFPDNQSPARY